MLNKKELEKFKSTLGFNLGQLEKDYLQHLFLLFLSRHIKDELIFKGGTALQKTRGLNRFSEDLDFTQLREININDLMNKISKNLTDFGFITKYEKIESKISENHRLRIKGPLFDGTEKSIASLRIEISLRNDLTNKPELIEIIPIYQDLEPYLIEVMGIEEILAEKIRTIFQRKKARDVYDIWFLTKKGIKINPELINKKMELIGLNENFNKKNFIKELSSIKKIWKEELSGYVTVVPDFNQVIKDIRNIL